MSPCQRHLCPGHETTRHDRDTNLEAPLFGDANYTFPLAMFLGMESMDRV